MSDHEEHPEQHPETTETTDQTTNPSENFPPYSDPSYLMPPSITVSATLSDGSLNNFTVLIEKLPTGSTLPYIGGYRDKRNGLIYHHSQTQTLSSGKVIKSNEHLRSRETQTTTLISKSSQSLRECGTQMERDGLHFDNKFDVILEVGSGQNLSYVTSNMLDEQKRKDALIIQNFYRGYLARRKAWSLRERIYNKEVEKVKNKEIVKAKDKERRKKEIERRLNPKSVKDFEVLYNELETWRHNEHAKISSNLDITSTEKKDMVSNLLAKETKLLQTIDKLKAVALTHGKTKRVNSMMNMMSQPKNWEGSSGNQMSVATPFTTRAKELSSLYQGLSEETLSVDERLDVLLNVKWTVNEFDCPLTRSLVSLLDREADLLNRARPISTLLGLRKRVLNLFLTFIETPEFNPESARFISGGEGTEEAVYKTLAAPSNWVEK